MTMAQTADTQPEGLPGDEFADTRAACETHRGEHGAGCEVHPVSVEAGRLLRTLVRLSGGRRVLEIGSGGGYGSLWLSGGVARSGWVESMESEPLHARLAREQLAAHDVNRLVTVVEADFRERAATVFGPYDFVLLQVAPRQYADLLPHLERMLRLGGGLALAHLDADWLAEDDRQAEREFLEAIGGSRHWDGLVVSEPHLGIWVRRE